MEHCMINGKRCSKCCEVLTIELSGNGREWIKYARWTDFETFEDKDKKELQLYWMIKEISRRRAKKLNPFLVSKIKGRQSYFICKHLKETGCTNYENRPSICSKYPYYGKTKEEFLKENKDYKGLYTDDCTFYIQIK